MLGVLSDRMIQLMTADYTEVCLEETVREGVLRGDCQRRLWDRKEDVKCIVRVRVRRIFNVFRGTNRVTVWFD